MVLQPESFASVRDRLASSMATWQETASTAALRDAVEALRWLVANADDQNAQRSSRANLGAVLQLLHEADTEADSDSSVRYLDEAVKIHQGLVTELPDGAMRLQQYANLANALRLHYEATGQVESLANGIDASRSSLSNDRATPTSAQRESTLALLLRARYLRYGNVSDIDEAVDLLRDALAAPLNASQSRRITSNLAQSLYERGYRHQRESDLLEALTLARSTLIDAPVSERAGILTNAGLAALHYHRLTNQADFVIEAVRYLETAALSGGTATERSGQMLNVSVARRLLFMASRHPDDLERSIEAAALARNQAVQQPDRAEADAAWGRALWVRFTASGSGDDAVEAVNRRTAVAEDPTAPALLRMDSARAAADGSMAIGDVESASNMYGHALDLLPLLGWLGLEPRSREHEAARLSGLASDAAAAALALHDPARALFDLDRGRAVLWRQSVELRMDLPVGHEQAQTQRRLRAVLEASTRYRDYVTPHDVD